MSIILLSVNDSYTYNYLHNLLRQDYTVISGFSNNFDLLIIGIINLLENRKMILAKKEHEKPYFLPVLLVLDKPDIAMLKDIPKDCIDDLIVTPVVKQELYSRVKMLLKSRNFSFGNLENQNLSGICIHQHDLTDISDHCTSAVKCLRRKEHMLIETQRITHLGTWEYNLKTAPLIEWSEEMYRIFGFAPGKITPSIQILIDSIHPEDRESMHQWLDKTMKGQSAGVLDFRIIVHNKNLKYIRGDGKPLFNEKGDVVGAIGTAQDITNQKLAEKALIHERDFSRQIIESLPGIFYIAEKNGRLIRWNKHFEQVTCFSADEITQINLSDLFADKNQLTSAMKKAFEQGQAELETALILKNGQSIPYLLTASIINCLKGKCLVGMGIDIKERTQMEKSLIESEAKLRLFIEHAPVALAMFDLNMHYIAASNRWISDYHLQDRKISGHSHYEIFPEIPEYWKSIHQRAMKGEIIRAEEDRFVRENGSIQWLRWEVRPWNAVSGAIGGVVIFTEDITQRKLAQEQLSAERERLAVTLRSIGDGVIATDTSNRVILMNKAGEKLTGWNHTEAHGKPLNQIFHIISEASHDTVPIPDVNRKFNGNHLLVSKNGNKINISVRGEPIIDNSGNPIGMVLVFKDITDYRKYENNLQSSVIQKEILLQELYHRTKNNMQVISALLELQAASSDIPELERIIKDSQFRIRAMALAHEKLYRSKSLSQIAMNEYIVDLVEQLKSSYGIPPEKITLNYELEDIALLIDVAIPCGLIINELVSNCFKHAFPGDRKGKIDISFHRKNSNLIELIIADNGVGLPAGFDIQHSTSLGIQLVRQIISHQLHGSIQAESDNGLRWSLHFRNDIYTERV